MSLFHCKYIFSRNPNPKLEIGFMNSVLNISCRVSSPQTWPLWCRLHNSGWALGDETSQLNQNLIKALWSVFFPQFMLSVLQLYLNPILKFGFGYLEPNVVTGGVEKLLWLIQLSELSINRTPLLSTGKYHTLCTICSPPIWRDCNNPFLVQSTKTQYYQPIF